MGRLPLWLIFLSSTCLATAQMIVTAPSPAMMARVFLIQAGQERGSAFVIEFNGREYLITAKHVLTGSTKGGPGELKSRHVKLQLLNPESQKWFPMEFDVLDPGSNLDAVALTTSTKLVGPQVENVTVGSKGTVFGSECEFLGFPYGSGWLGHRPVLS